MSCDSLTIDPEKWDGHNAPADSSRSEIAATPDVLGQSFTRYHPEMMRTLLMILLTSSMILTTRLFSESGSIWLNDFASKNVLGTKCKNHPQPEPLH